MRARGAETTITGLALSALCLVQYEKQAEEEQASGRHLLTPSTAASTARQRRGADGQRRAQSIAATPPPRLASPRRASPRLTQLALSHQLESPRRRLLRKPDRQASLSPLPPVPPRALRPNSAREFNSTQDLIFPTRYASLPDESESKSREGSDNGELALSLTTSQQHYSADYDRNVRGERPRTAKEFRSCESAQAPESAQAADTAFFCAARRHAIVRSPWECPKLDLRGLKHRSEGKSPRHPSRAIYQSRPQSSGGEAAEIWRRQSDSVKDRPAPRTEQIRHLKSLTSAISDSEILKAGYHWTGLKSRDENRTESDPKWTSSGGPLHRRYTEREETGESSSGAIRSVKVHDHRRGPQHVDPGSTSRGEKDYDRQEMFTRGSSSIGTRRSDVGWREVKQKGRLKTISSLDHVLRPIDLSADSSEEDRQSSERSEIFESHLLSGHPLGDTGISPRSECEQSESDSVPILTEEFGESTDSELATAKKITAEKISQIKSSRSDLTDEGGLTLRNGLTSAGDQILARSVGAERQQRASWTRAATETGSRRHRTSEKRDEWARWRSRTQICLPLRDCAIVKKEVSQDGSVQRAASCSKAIQTTTSLLTERDSLSVKINRLRHSVSDLVSTIVSTRWQQPSAAIGALQVKSQREPLSDLLQRRACREAEVELCQQSRNAEPSAAQQEAQEVAFKFESLKKSKEGIEAEAVAADQLEIPMSKPRPRKWLQAQLQAEVSLAQRRQRCLVHVGLQCQTMIEPCKGRRGIAHQIHSDVSPRRTPAMPLSPAQRQSPSGRVIPTRPPRRGSLALESQKPEIHPHIRALSSATHSNSLLDVSSALRVWANDRKHHASGTSSRRIFGPPSRLRCQAISPPARRPLLGQVDLPADLPSILQEKVDRAPPLTSPETVSDVLTLVIEKADATVEALTSKTSDAAAEETPMTTTSTHRHAPPETTPQQTAKTSAGAKAKPIMKKKAPPPLGKKAPPPGAKRGGAAGQNEADSPDLNFPFDGPLPAKDLKPKKLHWTPIPAVKIKGTIWDGLLERDLKLPCAENRIAKMEKSGQNLAVSLRGQRRGSICPTLSPGASMHDARRLSLSTEAPTDCARYPWERHRDLPFEPCKLQINHKEMENLFCVDESSGTKNVKSTKVKRAGVLDPRRTQNLEISLKGLGIYSNPDCVKRALVDLDLGIPETIESRSEENAKRLNAEELVVLSSLLPKSDEMELLTSAPAEEMTKGEKCILEWTVEIPRLKGRLECCIALVTYSEETSRVKKRLERQESAYQSLRELVADPPGALQTLLALCLKVGNFLNFYTPKRALGFTLSSHTAFKKTVANDNSTTILQIIAGCIDSQYPSLWKELEAGLSCCADLATMAPDDSRQQIAKLEESARRVRVELTEYVESYDSKFVRMMSNLVDTAAGELGVLRNRNDVVAEDLLTFGRNFNANISNEAEALECLEQLGAFWESLLKARHEHRDKQVKEALKDLRRSRQAATKAGAKNSD